MSVRNYGHTRVPLHAAAHEYSLTLTIGQRSSAGFVDQGNLAFGVRYAGPADLLLLQFQSGRSCTREEHDGCGVAILIYAGVFNVDWIAWCNALIDLSRSMVK